ncbi:MAG: 50S ribosomal protein L32 [Alphaproteobacteria bacterium]|nr:50S ribosomal protein L32 [Rickettsiales bacterium]
MAVPKKKKSKSRSGHGNSHNAIKQTNLIFDEEGDLHRSHVATKLPDGSLRYKGRVVVQVRVRKKKTNNTEAVK